MLKVRFDPKEPIIVVYNGKTKILPKTRLSYELVAEMFQEEYKLLCKNIEGGEKEIG